MREFLSLSQSEISGPAYTATPSVPPCAVFSTAPLAFTAADE